MIVWIAHSLKRSRLCSFKRFQPNISMHWRCWISHLLWQVAYRTVCLRLMRQVSSPFLWLYKTFLKWKFHRVNPDECSLGHNRWRQSVIDKMETPNCSLHWNFVFTNCFNVCTINYCELSKRWVIARLTVFPTSDCCYCTSIMHPSIRYGVVVWNVKCLWIVRQFIIFNHFALSSMLKKFSLLDMDKLSVFLEM